ncbi:MAG: hypothetical protein IPN90_05395 [Elusimicrobia bacterium]|nr:hypothetical protein [Elusimicrobiota bacterium]
MKRLILDMDDALYGRLEREAQKRGSTLTKMVSNYLSREFPKAYLDYLWESCKAYHARPSSTPSDSANGSKPIYS